MGTALALALLVALTTAGRVVDGLRGGTTALALAFLAGCLLASLLVRREGLLGVCLAPPLVLAGVVAAAALGSGGSGVQDSALSAGTDLVVLFPVMATGTAAAVVVALVRLLTIPSTSAHRRR